MANYKSQKEIVQSIASSIDDLEAGKLSLEALEAHVDLVRELYERSIVLRYKAFEKSVGKSDIEVISQKTKDESQQTEDILPFELQKVEIKVEDDASAIEFNLFEDEEEDEKLEIETISPLLTQVSEPMSEKTIESFIPEPEAKVIVETPGTDETQQPISLAQAGEFLSKFQSVENELSKQLGFSKLETLVGSFGLNERLQYINELFDGSSEQFSDTVKSLDILPNINSAKSMTADLAIQNNWDLESETVEEFIQKICRRYA